MKLGKNDIKVSLKFDLDTGKKEYLETNNNNNFILPFIVLSLHDELSNIKYKAY